MTDRRGAKNLVEVLRAVTLFESLEIGHLFSVRQTEWEQLARGISGVADILYQEDVEGRRAFLDRVLGGALGGVLGVEVTQVAEPVLPPPVE